MWLVATILGDTALVLLLQWPRKSCVLEGVAARQKLPRAQGHHTEPHCPGKLVTYSSLTHLFGGAYLLMQRDLTCLSMAASGTPPIAIPSESAPTQPSSELCPCPPGCPCLCSCPVPFLFLHCSTPSLFSLPFARLATWLAYPQWA